MDDLNKIKELFKKLYAAVGWARLHPQDGEPELWQERVLPLLDKYYDELEKLGVPREFSMCLFCFGIDYLTAVRSWTTELPLDNIKK